MLIYDQYAGNQEWNPRVVDELGLDELFWLPIVKQAKNDAIGQMGKAKDGPLQYLT
jgi:hypothetical protein